MLVLAAGSLLVFAARPRSSTRGGPVPTVSLASAKNSEGCLLCHATTQGLGPAHGGLDCSSCHLGDPSAREASLAHQGMEVLAGNLASVDRTCGQATCHPIETARVLTSLMARAPGILAVDRFAFGERATPDGDKSDDLSSIDPAKAPASPAEAHARQLCASCHLGAPKEQRGDLGAQARGGGCTACHLAAPYPRRRETGGPLHPDVSAVVSERRCEGCHARSGRIALSFRGIVELEPVDPRVTGTLPDGRKTGAASADVHAKAGMTCIDCHTERELMGDGALYRHSNEARDVTCEACHRAVVSKPTDKDREAVATRLRAAWERRGLPPLPSGPWIRTAAGTPLWRTDATAKVLALVTSGEHRPIPQATAKPYHAMPGHDRLSCQSCHAQWAPRCRSCHTRLEASGTAIDHLSGKPMVGRWVEEAGENGFGPPLLAMGPRGRIEPFVEGMRLRIDGAGDRPIERTLWAPLEPHTTGTARACASCHAPTRVEDVYPSAGETTRSGARLLDAVERARIIGVGRCIACHGYDDAIYLDFRGSQARLAKRDARRCQGKPE
jgi:hypothetical protein